MTRTADLLERVVEASAGTALVGKVADLLGPLMKKIPEGPVKDTLSGTQLGHPVHPSLATAAIGLLTTTSVLDVAGEPRAARVTLAAGLVTALPTIAAGWSDWAETGGLEKRVGIVHSTTNAVGVGLYLASWKSRRDGGSGAALAAAGSALMAVGGWLGGHLSYAYGVGVDTTAFQAGPSGWTDVASSDDLTTKPLAVHADGVPVVLVREGWHVRALADRCTHRGAPLSDGDVEDGCLVCPWHGSRFSLVDGSVEQGPATRPQPVYEVRESAGRLEVRRSEDRALRKNPVA